MTTPRYIYDVHSKGTIRDSTKHREPNLGDILAIAQYGKVVYRLIVRIKR